MKSIFKYIFIVFVILLGLSGLFTLFEKPNQAKENISLSQVVAKINSGEAKEILVKGDILEIKTAEENKLYKSKKEPGISVAETLVNLGVDKTKLSQVNINVKEESGFVLILANILPFVLPLLFILFIFWFMFRQTKQGAMQAFSFTKSKARLALPSNKKKITFRDVAGLQEVKQEIEEVVEFLKEPAKFHKLGAKIPRGILLIGAPGTGKTLLAKAVANEANVPFYFVSGSEFVEMFVGVGANRVRDTFEQAKQTAPSIVFIDEIDAVGRHRGAGLGGGHDEREQTLNQILVEMDGFDSHNSVIVMASTNRPDILDPALLRPGRFDRRIILDIPSLNDREEILKIHAEGKPIAKDVKWRTVAERTSGFSGADLANLANEAAILAARQGRQNISQENLLQSIEKVMLGPERKSHALSPKEKEVTAYHEAGHALIAASLPKSDPVHKISIVSRGRAGGYTLKLPSEDKHLKTKPEFESELAVLLGGYTAEKLIFKEVTTGASNDLRVASEIARKMVTEYGMSDTLGPVTYGEKEEMVFLGREISSHKNYSESIAQQIDQEMKKFISKAVLVAKKVLSEKLEILHRIAKELIKKETLEQKEFYSLLKA
ncbi:MAG: cell division protein FtsH [Candidatus Yanofskybacteria bacterium RIFCSPHIGHO2_02_FULL_43_15c]|uniref:ATP-dependent zinc metalloprotease FtsH n=1 Tax=Candidatus Yanofskybacteria bacterium RIFCSPHIGHO2_02_FULL_43_15c TaxID=1802679 RepID=A0A1F8FIL5_9BACT|nr:MAG: cell division protein FtsH [Candidatus Yanofskybacteria bacterium RIFCSPHIGHO2_02_FULL_43_15c]